MLHVLTRQVAEWFRVDREIRRLSRLDDHLLADLGIDRDRIPALLRGRRPS